MVQVEKNGEMGAEGPTGLQVALLEQQLAALERPPGERRAGWLWVLVVAGLLALGGFGFQTYSNYATLSRIDGASNISTANVVVLFQDVATNGPRVGSTVEASNRATYTKSLEQFLLGGTGVCLGIVVIVGGLFVRANQG